MPREIKSGWHLLCCYLAWREFATSRDNARRFAAGAFGGFHLWAVLYDWKGK